MRILALVLLAYLSGSCWAQQQQVDANGKKHSGSAVCNNPEANCVRVICFGMFRATDLIDPNGEEYIVPDGNRYPGANRFGAIQVAGPLPGNGKIVVTYHSNFQGQGEVLTISKENPLDGTTISAMSNSQNPSAALIWGPSQGTAEKSWEIYCKKAL